MKHKIENRLTARSERPHRLAALSITPGATLCEPASATLVVRLATLFILLFASVPTANAGRLLSQLPNSTIAVLRIEDGDAWQRMFPATSISKVIQSGTFKPLREYLAIGGVGETALQRVGLRSQDIKRLSQGEIIFARLLLANDQRGSLAAFEVDAATAKAVMKDLERSLAKVGATKKVLPNTDGFRVRFTTSDGKLDWTYSFSDGIFSVGDSEQLAEVLSPAGSLAANEQFRTTMERTKLEATPSGSLEAQWFIRPWAMFDNPRSETVDKLLKQGFDGIQSVGGRLQFNPQKTSHRTFVAADKPLRQAASGLTFMARSVPTVPSWISPNVTSCLATHIDFPAAMAGYGHWFDETHGGGDPGLFDIVLDDIRDEPDAPQVDIRNDLVRQLSGPLLSLAISDDNETASRLFAVAVKDATVVSKAVAGMLKGDPDVSKFELDGFPAWKFGDLSRKGTRQILGPDLSGLSICIAHNHLISCPSETTLRDILSRTNGSTGSEFQSQLQTAAEELNVTKPVGIGFSKNLGQVGNLYQRILGEQSAKSKNPTIVPELLRAFQLEVNDREIKKFQSKLPSTKVVSSLFGRSIDAAEDANDGWLLKGVIYRKD